MIPTNHAKSGPVIATVRNMFALHLILPPRQTVEATTRYWSNTKKILLMEHFTFIRADLRKKRLASSRFSSLAQLFNWQKHASLSEIQTMEVQHLVTVMTEANCTLVKYTLFEGDKVTMPYIWSDLHSKQVTTQQLGSFQSLSILLAQTFFRVFGNLDWYQQTSTKNNLNFTQMKSTVGILEKNPAGNEADTANFATNKAAILIFTARERVVKTKAKRACLRGCQSWFGIPHVLWQTMFNCLEHESERRNEGTLLPMSQYLPRRCSPFRHFTNQLWGPPPVFNNITITLFNSTNSTGEPDLWRLCCFAHNVFKYFRCTTIPKQNFNCLFKQIALKNENNC